MATRPISTYRLKGILKEKPRKRKPTKKISFIQIRSTLRGVVTQVAFRHLALFVFVNITTVICYNNKSDTQGSRLYFDIAANGLLKYCDGT